jgi:hypothetical protein
METKGRYWRMTAIEINVPIIRACVPYPNHGKVHSRTLKSIAEAKECRDYYLGGVEIRGTSISTSRNLGINRGESDATTQRLTGFDYFLSLDADIVFTSKDIKALIAHDKDIVSGAYTYRGNTSKYVAGNFDNRGIITDGGFADKALRHGLERVDFVGAGFLLIKRDALNRMAYPWFYESIISYLDNGIPKAQIVGDDIGFCLGAQRAGFDIYCDFDCAVEHIIN